MTDKPEQPWERTSRSGAALLSIAIALASFGAARSVCAASSAVSSSVQPATHSFNFSYIITVAPPASSSKERVWVPLPSTDQFQTISELQLKAPSNIRMHKDSRYGNRYAFFTLDPSRVKTPFEIRLTFHVVRYERRVELTSAADLSGPFPKEVAPFLQPDRFIPIDGDIARLAREQTQSMTDPIEKARKIYEYVTSTVRDNRSDPDRVRSDSASACDSHHGDCADFESQFIGMARAEGIPARFDMGFLLPKEQKGGAILDYHCWAEFYVNGIGWIPVDAAEAGQEPDKHDHFFGAIDADRVTFSMGRDVPLTPMPKAGPLKYSVYPYIEVNGKPYVEYSTDFFFHDTGIPSAPLGKKQIFADGHLVTGGRPHFPS
jgi:hypothetical protein